MILNLFGLEYNLGSCPASQTAMVANDGIFHQNVFSRASDCILGLWGLHPPPRSIIFTLKINQHKLVDFWCILGWPLASLFSGVQRVQPYNSTGDSYALQGHQTAAMVAGGMGLIAGGTRESGTEEGQVIYPHHLKSM